MPINATGARRLGFTPDGAVGKKVDLIEFVGSVGTPLLAVAKSRRRLRCEST
jgi:hypothetical protein